MKYVFYYDESEHSREIGFDTITAENFCDNFVSAVVGWRAGNELKIEQAYAIFEDKYRYRKNKSGEIKSTTIKPDQVKYGFASMSKETVSFLDDYLSCFTKDVFLYFSSISKIEYIVTQLFENYQNSMLLDMDAFKYTITKALVINKPIEIIEHIYSEPSKVVEEIRAFLQRKIVLDRSNPELKRIEIEAFQQALLILDDIQPLQKIKWDYRPPFVGFDKFLKENAIEDYELIIDREGNEKNTVLDAIKVGLSNVSDIDSSEKFAVRMADILAGIIAKLMKSLCRSLHPINPNSTEKTVLSKEWFRLNEEQLSLYKKMYNTVCRLNNSWYKSFAGIYADDFISFIALLNYMNRFSSAKEIERNVSMQGEYFNEFVCDSLSEYYDRMHSKLPIDIVHRKEIVQGYFYNQRGAKVYVDSDKQPFLPLVEGENRYLVLSVGLDKQMRPLVTIEKDKTPICYRLPVALNEWALTCVGFSNFGENMFPSEVVFHKRSGEYYADIT